MCTVARLVQGGTVTEWLGMPMAGQALPSPNVRLVAGLPAFLEVAINPAAHGEAGLGPISRSVVLETEGGNRIQFDLRAQVER